MYHVNVDGLNFRSEPSAERRGNILAVLPRGHPVSKLAEGTRGWWRVRTELSGRPFEGFVAFRFLVPAGEGPETPVHRGGIPEVHMLAKKGRRNLDVARAYPLGDPGVPARERTTDVEKARELIEIVRYLDVEKSLRYQPTSYATYCNIYAYDVCFLGKVYLPRVWWTDRAIRDLAKGETVSVQYGATVQELNANALYEWLADWGDDFGWVRTASLTELQDAANVGRVAVICARRKDRNRAGHIATVVPEAEAIIASRNGSDVTRPVQTQAGISNHLFWVPPRWWTDARFDGFGFWHTDETKPSVEL